jgi:hypothetical protein
MPGREWAYIAYLFLRDTSSITVDSRRGLGRIRWTLVISILHISIFLVLSSFVSYEDRDKPERWIRVETIMDRVPELEEEKVRASCPRDPSHGQFVSFVMVGQEWLVERDGQAFIHRAGSGAGPQPKGFR